MAAIKRIIIPNPWLIIYRRIADLLPDVIYNLSNNIDPGELPLALDAETMTALHEKGLIIDAWTVDSEENIRDLVASKVDFLTTNYLERAIGIKKEMQNK